MRFVKFKVVLAFMAAVFLFGAPSLHATPVVIDFSTGSAGSGGTISVSGGQASGSGILINLLQVIGAPMHNGMYTVTGTGTGHTGSTAVLDFNTATNFIKITGKIPGLGINSSTVLLNGSFSSFTVTNTGTVRAIAALGPDTKSPVLLQDLGLPTNLQFQFFGFTISSKLSGSRYVAYSTDISNTANVPEPGTLLLLAIATLGFGGVMAFKQRSAQQI